MTTPVSAIEAIEKFGPDADWDAGAHVRLLRANGGPSSGYTADLIQNLHCTVVALARQAEALQREAEKLPHIVEYRRHGQAAWTPMAAFDGELIAERYCADCNNSRNAKHWEYRVRARALLGGENAE
ncbi:hypothetical protein NN6n1_12760 [Shinella zoogloeoides]